jgi:hypothetical protein
MRPSIGQIMLKDPIVEQKLLIIDLVYSWWTRSQQLFGKASYIEKWGG